MIAGTQTRLLMQVSKKSSSYPAWYLEDSCQYWTKRNSDQRYRRDTDYGDWYSGSEDHFAPKCPPGIDVCEADETEVKEASVQSRIINGFGRIF